jgi:hypothetical protein
MSFLGNTPTTQSFTSLTERFNGDGSTTTITLSRAVYNASDIEVLVNNVQQDPYEAYTVNGTQTLTFTGAPSVGTGNIIVTYRNYTITKFVPTEGTVTAASIADGSITGVKLASSTITGDKIGLTAITGNLLASATITGDKLGLSSITSNLIAANAITTAAIADGSINTSELAAGAVTGDKLGTGSVTSNSFAPTVTTGNVNLSGATSFLSTVFETANVTTLMGANTTINVAQPLVVFTANSSANSTVNFTGLAGMPVGNTASFTIINPNSSTPKYISAYQIDGSATTVKWAGGAPIGAASANTDIYSFSIIKTSATPTYNVFASVQNFF